jgi:hypothetical protein
MESCEPGSWTGSITRFSLLVIVDSGHPGLQMLVVGPGRAYRGV